MARYIIQNTNDRALYWSNRFGWCALVTADTFTETERARLNLPTGGTWAPKPETKTGD